VTVVHWDDHPGDDLALAVGAGWACVRRLTIGPGEPLHLDGEDRETLAWLLDRDVVVARRPGDVERSLRAEGPTDLLVFAAGAPLATTPEDPEPVVVVRVATLPRERVRDGQTAIIRRDVGTPAGALGVALELVDVDPLGRSHPVLDQEEISVVLSGSGRVRLADGERDVRAGSVVGQAERFTAGDGGLRVVTFREQPA
jgi:mannose-6-phosphate isomerase-like protein (cupin superfamily)